MNQQVINRAAQLSAEDLSVETRQKLLDLLADEPDTDTQTQLRWMIEGYDLTLSRLVESDVFVNSEQQNNG